jgi:hypothetical protein
MMNVKDLLKHYDIKESELSAFMGIPRGRISMWKGAPRKIEDAKIYEETANFFASMPIEDVKIAIKNYRIIAGNIEPLKGYQQTITSGKVNEKNVNYERKSDVNGVNSLTGGKDEDSDDLVNLGFTKIDTLMLNRMLSIIENANANISKSEDNVKIMAESNLVLAKAIDRLVPGTLQNIEGAGKAAER